MQAFARRTMNRTKAALRRARNAVMFFSSTKGAASDMSSEEMQADTAQDEVQDDVSDEQADEAQAGDEGGDSVTVTVPVTMVTEERAQEMAQEAAQQAVDAVLEETEEVEDDDEGELLEAPTPILTAWENYTAKRKATKAAVNALADSSVLIEAAEANVVAAQAGVVEAQSGVDEEKRIQSQRSIDHLNAQAAEREAWDALVNAGAAKYGTSESTE